MFRLTTLTLLLILALALAGCGGGGGSSTPQAPQPPTSLTATRSSTDPSIVTLTWSAPGGSGVSGYVVDRQIEGQSFFTRLATVPASQLTYQDTLPTYAKYLAVTYQVSSINSSNQQSDPAQASIGGGPPPPP